MLEKQIIPQIRESYGAQFDNMCGGCKMKLLVTGESWYHITLGKLLKIKLLDLDLKENGHQDRQT